MASDSQTYKLAFRAGYADSRPQSSVCASGRLQSAGRGLVVILNFQVRLVADVGLCDWLWCTLNIAAIGSDSRVDSGDY